jgi:hypothetical protein
MLIPSTAGAKNPTATINCHMAPADYFQKSVLVKCDICQAESQQRQSFRILAAPEYLICSIALVTTLRTRLVKDKHPQVNRTTPLKYKLVNTIVHKDEAQQGYWITGVTGAEKQVYSINDRQVTAMTNAFLRQNLQWGAFNVTVAIYHRLETTGPRHGISEVVENNGELYVCLA